MNERYYVSTYRRAVADGGALYRVMDAECSPEPLVEEFRSEAKAKRECARQNELERECARLNELYVSTQQV
jgi:hypothetical protein